MLYTFRNTRWFSYVLYPCAPGPTPAEGIRAKFPDKMLAYNCSPSFNWEKNLTKEQIATFQQELGKMGYKFQFVTLAGEQGRWGVVAFGGCVCVFDG